MLTSPLENLARDGGSLRAESPDVAEWTGLIRSGLVRLADAKRGANSLESRFDLTYGLGPDVWRVLDKCHKLRNQSEYEGELLVDDRMVTDLISACDAVAAALEG